MNAGMLSPERVASCTRALEAAIERARAAGQPVLCIHRERLEDAPSGLEVFAQAERSGERRFFAARPARGFELTAVGCVERLSCDSDDVFDELARRAASVLGEDAPDACWVGGIAFDPTAPRASHWSAFGRASFALPELTLTRRDGATWLTLATRVSGSSAPQATLTRVGRWLEKSGPVDAPRARTAAHGPATLPAYASAVTRVLDDIRRGRAQKAVIACEHRVPLGPGWQTAGALRGLLHAHPDCLGFAQGIGASTFLGATPELLVQREGLRLRSAALAATAPRDASSETEARLARQLWASGKERTEHALVVQAIAESLAPVCRALEIPDTPRVLRTGTLQHLHTPIRATLRTPVHVLELARRLHPTPALGGHPRGPALELIRQHEGFDRGWYAGPLGWFDARGEGELFVALRCALASRGELRLFAGSGLVEDSDVARETRETGLKLGSILEAVELW